MNHSFDVELAKLYGVDAAIMIENFRFWIAKNKANGRHFYDDRWWTYNSVKAFSELFPYWSAPQIRRILDRLEEQGVLTSGTYNQNTYDRTKWYSLNQQMHLPNSSNGVDGIGKTLDRTDINTDATAGFARFWDAWPKSQRKGSKANCLGVWKRRNYEPHTEAIVRHVEALKTSQDWTKDNGRYIPSPLTYLNQRRWDGVEDGDAPQDRFLGVL